MYYSFWFGGGEECEFLYIKDGSVYRYRFYFIFFVVRLIDKLKVMNEINIKVYILSVVVF